ncbi:hypothetical protein [Pollutimonas bauzanensis]|uniref:DUF4351 domain-containing protein n=1 Tax=Pollutimonas bauzanensis TaxID=658167 RepID=A0A1M5UP03_9BURK|nr:hypothetical protein [Pollutimonas bauzanensis]SHH64689.1 hypothetical protein SAMN04488135_10459 [Pollutimonas bauzanensis]
MVSPPRKRSTIKPPPDKPAKQRPAAKRAPAGAGRHHTSGADGDNSSTLNTVRNDYDSPWKDALEQYFEPALALLMPELHAIIDWSHPPQFLDKEFQAVSHSLRRGRRQADKLVKVRTVLERPAWLLVHVEAQGGGAGPRALAGLALRMQIYCYRIVDRNHIDHEPKRKPRPSGRGQARQDQCGAEGAPALWRRSSGRQAGVLHFAQGSLGFASFAILTNSRGGPPQLDHRLEFQGSAEPLGSGMQFRCPVIHLGQWWSRWAELEARARSNPFAVIVIAQLQAHAHHRDGPGRLAAKIGLMELLYRHEYGRDDIISLYRLVDWILILPPALEPAFEQALEAIEKEHNVAYVTSIERRAEKRGMELGLERGLERGELRGKLMTLQQQMVLKFGPLPSWAKARLEAADEAALSDWTGRILVAGSLEDLLGAIDES